MKLIRDRTTGRTIQAVKLEPTASKPLRVELLVRNSAGTRLGDHTMVFEATDALKLVNEIMEVVAGDVAGASGVTSVLMAHGVIPAPFERDGEPDEAPTAELPASRQRGPFVVHDGGST